MKEKILWLVIITAVLGLVALPILYPNPHLHQFHSPPQPYNYPYTPQLKIVLDTALIF